jgi:hypothetical protein
MMQPMKVAEVSPRIPPLQDLAVELTGKASAFHSSSPAGIR